jgi:opacity protein-like surface antigen
MRRANGAILGILLATVAVPAFAADMPVKAAPPPPPLPDWSGVYSGIAAGGAWGRQNLNTPVTPLNNLFGTSADRIFNGSPVLIQPDFDMGFCAIDGCNRLKTNGFIGGGFAGVQKQWGNWVIGIEGSWDWTSMKKGISATTSDLEDVVRIVPTTTVTIPGEVVNIPAQTVALSNGNAVVAGQNVNITGPIRLCPGLLSCGPVLAPGTVVPAGTVVGIAQTANNIGSAPFAVPGEIKLVLQQNVTVGAGGVATTSLPFFTVPGQNAPVTGVVNIPAQTVVANPTSVTIGLPRETTVRATVTRSVDVSSKIDQIADIRGKFGFANGFMGPNWLFYFTGGAAVGHFERTLTLTQTVSVVGDGTRTNTFQSSTGDTRLGWVVGAGFDWKMTPNVLLGVLYRHHEFPSSTISFVDDSGGSGRPVSFGSSRAHVDSVQGRLSWLFPIQ